MSDFSDIGNYLLNIWQVQVPDVKTSLDEVVLDQLPADQFPNVQVLESIENNEEIDPFQQITQRFEITFLYARMSSDRNTMWTDMDKVRDAIEADRSLGGLVDKTQVLIREVPNPVKDRSLAGFTIQTSKDR